MRKIIFILNHLPISIIVAVIMTVRMWTEVPHYLQSFAVWCCCYWPGISRDHCDIKLTFDCTVKCKLLFTSGCLSLPLYRLWSPVSESDVDRDRVTKCTTINVTSHNRASCAPPLCLAWPRDVIMRTADCWRHGLSGAVKLYHNTAHCFVTFATNNALLLIKTSRLSCITALGVYFVEMCT